MIRFGLVGTNTSHAGVFAGIFNGTADTPAALDGGRVVSVWGEPDAGRLAAAHGIEEVVDDPARMLGGVDAVLVVDDRGGGATHGALARPFLEAGVPTFIDKPMALDVREAVTLFDLAEESGAPLMSSSALRYAAELAGFRERLPELGRLSSVVSVGPGDWYYYGIHAVEMLLSVVGPGASWVHRHAFPDRDVAVIAYDNGPTATVQTLRDARYVFHLTAYGAEGWASCEVSDHDAFYTRLMAAVLDMASTGRSPVSREQTLEILSVLAAGVRSAEADCSVRLSDVVPS
ncbi:MAG: Gfo/Idh/MocA family oxidoreductase [Chloroflexota bacterium]|nr:Gfo/Idh/MocA family oxidoreductase [Chloroflexota bacterium]